MGDGIDGGEDIRCVWWPSGRDREILRFNGVEYLRCPECGEGDVRFTGRSWLTYPCGHQHKCGVCGYLVAVKGEVFPREGR